MQLLINILISSIIQLLLVIIIPFVWWIFTAKKKKIKFFEWIGIKSVKKENRRVVFILLSIGAICFSILSISIISLNNLETATNQFYGLGVLGILPALIYSFIQTAFTEEVFFRGFLLKRISNKFGFNVGNLIQSILFGLLHGIMFINLTTVLITFVIILLTSVIAFFMGYINERKANGSIIPSWIIHGVSNTLSAVLSLFKLI